MSQIECKDVSVKYENQVVLEDISFSIEQGDYLCIVGENGSGKSTLVKTILGLENSKLGQIVFGEGLNKNEIGYLPQQTQAQKDFPASVYEVVLSGCLNSKGFSPFYSMKDKKLANEMIKSLGIENIKRKSFRELSGGQQQRVSIGRAIINNPAIMLADEPTGNLDSKSSEEIISLLRLSNKKYNQTVIIITHDEKIALEADRVITIDDGKIIKDEKC